MKKAETQLSEAQDTRSVPQYAHYTFDFAEQVHIPHHARQVGPIYFKVCRKIQVFGICCDSNRKQVNNYVTGYLAWRIIKGKHQETTLSFMRVGHTRCLVDGHFGLIKKIYHQSDTDTPSQMADVVL